jgi:hypothetical protein
MWYPFRRRRREDERQTAALKALCVVLYSLGKGSCNMLGKIFGRKCSLIYRWIREAGLRTAEPAIDGNHADRTRRDMAFP